MVNRSNRYIIFVDSYADLTSRIAKQNYIYVVKGEKVAYYWDDGYYPLSGYSIPPIVQHFSNINVMNVEHDSYKNVDFKVEKVINQMTGEYETVVPDKVTRRDSDMDIYVRPKMNTKVTVYP